MTQHNIVFDENVAHARTHFDRFFFSFFFGIKLPKKNYGYTCAVDTELHRLLHYYVVFDGESLTKIYSTYVLVCCTLHILWFVLYQTLTGHFCGWESHYSIFDWTMKLECDKSNFSKKNYSKWAKMSLDFFTECLFAKLNRVLLTDVSHHCILRFFFFFMLKLRWPISSVSLAFIFSSEIHWTTKCNWIGLTELKWK